MVNAVKQIIHLMFHVGDVDLLGNKRIIVIKKKQVLQSPRWRSVHNEVHKDY